MATDGVYFDDPSEAVEYLQGKVLGKKLLGASGMEIRPTDLPQGPKYLGLARMRASNRTDFNVIPRVAIAGAKHGQIPVWVIPGKGAAADQIPGALAAAAVSAPNGELAAGAYRVDFPTETPADQLVSFAQQAILAMGVAPDQGWQWVSRSGGQLPH